MTLDILRRPIFNLMISIGNKIWHEKCFRCNGFDSPLGEVMNSPLRSHIAVAALAISFAAGNAWADPVVEAPAYTPEHGVAGGPTVFHPTLKITSGGLVDFNSIYLWDFILDWNETALGFDPVASTISFGGYSGSLSDVTTYLAGIGSPFANSDNAASATSDGFYKLSWESDGNDLLDLGSEINFTGAFMILAGAIPGDSLIDFEVNGNSSSIIDMDFDYFSYAGVSPALQGPARQMMITVDAPTVIPEPGMIGLLLGGLGAYLGAIRLRRKTAQ